MCDYCDCRSQPEIGALSADHERLLSITAAIRRSVAAGAGAGPLVDELAAVLGPHADREERGVFRALRRLGAGDAYVGRLEADHTRIDGLVATAGDDPRHAVALVDLLEDHILREESDVYPAARQMLAPADWDDVDAAVRHPHTTTGAPS